MKLRPGLIVGWICALLVAAFHVLAAIGKIIPPAPGSAGDQFAIAVGMRGLEIPLFILQSIIVVLFLIPRTSTVGFVLMVGYMGGILAAMLTHGFSTMDALAIYIAFGLLTISAYFRNPELLSRLLGRSVPERI